MFIRVHSWFLFFLFSRLPQFGSLIAVVLIASPLLSAPGDTTAQSISKTTHYFPLSGASRGSLRSVLVPDEDIRLSSPAGGLIVSYHFEEGDTISKNSIILELDSDYQRAEVASANALLEGSMAELTKAQKDFDRAQALRRENINSEKQLEEAEYHLALAKGRHNERLANLSKAEVRLRERYIRSPIEGIFLKKAKSVGEAVQRLETVARVVDDTQLTLIIYCDSSLFGEIDPALSYSIELLDGPHKGRIIPGDVFHIDPLIDPSSGTFRVKLRVRSHQYGAAGISARFIPSPVPLAGRVE